MPKSEATKKLYSKKFLTALEMTAYSFNRKTL